MGIGFILGEFVGGCDIVREVYESGELAQLLEQTGIAAGVLLGGLLGGATGSYLDDQDKRTAANTTQQALDSKPSGTTTTWTNPDSSHSGSVTPLRTYQANNGQPVLPRVRAERDHRRQAAEELRHGLPAAGRLLADRQLSALAAKERSSPQRNE